MEGRRQPAHIVGPDDQAGYSQPLMHGDVGPQSIIVVRGDDLQKPGAREAAFPADDLTPVAEDAVRSPGQRGLRFEVVVHPHQTAGSAGGTGGNKASLEDDRSQASPGQVKGEAGAVNPRTDDDGI